MFLALTGMPGCGKTTIGQRLATARHWRFVDTDELTQALSGRTIADMFAEDEQLFRDWESRAVASLSGCTQTIVSLGGGAILRAENVRALRAGGGRIFMIDRPLEAILRDVDTASRPLLKDGPDRLYALYDARDALYRAAAERIIPNDGSIDETVKAILCILKEEEK